MSWKVDKIGDEIVNVIPLNDSKQHYDGLSWTDETDTYHSPIPKSICSCNPRREYISETGRWMFIHNSFDGREGLEWATQILKNE